MRCEDSSCIYNKDGISCECKQDIGLDEYHECDSFEESGEEE